MTFRAFRARWLVQGHSATRTALHELWLGSAVAPALRWCQWCMRSMRKSAGSAGFARCGCKRLELKARQAKATEGVAWPCSAAHAPGRHRRLHPGFSSASQGLTPPHAGASSPRQPRVVAGRTSVDLALGSTELSTALARGSCGVEARRRSVRTARHDHGLPWAAGTGVRGCQAWRGR